MSLSHLQTAVERAAWVETDAHGVHGAHGAHGASGAHVTNPRRAVLLTSCDLKCMEALMETFLSSLQGSSDGDATSHVVVVSIGTGSHHRCTQMQSQFK